MNKIDNISVLIILCMAHYIVAMNSITFWRDRPLQREGNRSFYECYYEKSLQKAIDKADFVCVESLLDHAPSLANTVHVQQALCTLLKESQYDLVKSFLKRKVNPNVIGERGNSLLHVADNFNMVQLLLDYGACVQNQNNKGETPLFKAMKHSRIDLAQLLLKAGADVNQGDKNNDTPLHYAVKNQMVLEGKFLLYHGADSHQKNSEGRSAYDIARECGKPFLEAFEEYEKIFFIHKYPHNYKHLNVTHLLAHEGRYLKQMFIANEKGYCSSDIAIVADVLKEYYKNLDELGFVCSVYSSSLLHFVSLIKNRSTCRENFLRSLCNNNVSLARELVRFNPYVLYTYQDEHPLNDARDLLVDKFLSISSSTSDYCYIRDLLHECCFDLDDLCNDYGQSLLCQLIMYLLDHQKCIDILKTGVNVNRLDNFGKSPLWYAIQLDDEDNVIILLRYGAVIYPDMLYIRKCSTSLWMILYNAFKTQKCFVCDTHPDEMSHIPCVNRHLGYFICKKCYDRRSTRCPICRHGMGAFGQ